MHRFISCFFWVIFTINLSAQINLPWASDFRYLTGDKASGIDAGWNKTTYNDTAWPVSKAPFGYGDPGINTQLSSMREKFSTVFFRSSFSASNIDLVKEIIVKANFDDGFVMWINGIEVLRQNAPNVLAYNSLATVNHESGLASEFKIDATKCHLQANNNIVAVMAFNVTLTSSDFFFDMSLEAFPELPAYDYGHSKIEFSHPGGFYNKPFQLTLTNPNPGLLLKFTIDGSNPGQSVTAKQVSDQVVLPIDPSLTQGRGKTPAFVVRVALVKEGFAASFPQTRTFIFPEEVKSQKHPGGEWPVQPVKGKKFDFEMASDVVNNPEYSALIEKALLEIPTLSIATDMKHLFDQSTGIYVNSEQKGIEWERAGSVELLRPDGSPGFSVNTGIRIRGGNSAKNKDNAKNGFRLFFREEYGAPKLEYPLFGEEGVAEFDKIDLRCEQNYSWNMDGSPYNNLVKDVFCRDLLGAMGQPYSRGRYYHLYLNGMYWGIFQTDERPEASYAESYLGGDEEDYDVIKVNTQPWPYYNEATDGNMDSWEALWALCQTGFAANQNYFALEGKDASGKRLENMRVWVDIDNLIDFMMVIFYSGNYDAPVSAWSGNDMPNNFFAIFDRVNQSKGYKFVNHDSEHCLFVDRVNIGAGLNENRVNIGTNGQMRINNVLDFNPQWLHYRLCSNPEYRLRFADRAYLYLSGSGLLTPQKATELYRYRASQIDTAIIAESARWGDAQVFTSLTRNDHWIPTIESMYKDYFPYRTAIVEKQLKDENLYPVLPAPEVYKGNEKINTIRSYFTGNTKFLLKQASGTTIYYTLNGDDPRDVGGAVSTSAKLGEGEVEIVVSSTICLKARVKNGSQWGALKTCYLTLEKENFSALKITELCYHPQGEVIGGDTLFDESFEFLEFKNTGTAWIDLSGLKLDSAIRYAFPEYTLLGPGQFYVVAGKSNWFYKRFGRYPSGNFQGKLSNSGEYILLNDRHGSQIFSLTYDDRKPWPSSADGKGSLVPVEINPTGNPDVPSYWRATVLEYGSPFSDDLPMSDPKNFRNVALTVYPNPTNQMLSVTLSGEWAHGAFLSLYTLDGRMVFNGNFDRRQIDVDLAELALPKGIYVLKANGKGWVKTSKIVYH